MEVHKTTEFRQIVWDFYGSHGRHNLPWRTPEANGSFDPYKILVSEIMLQQTQVSRVVPKYQTFLEMFPTIQVLATASLGDVLAIWNGLGYNRRAKFLWQAAQVVVNEWHGKFPISVEQLQQLPGVGANTAGAVAVYSYNRPEVFIETNIRTVFIHHFLKDQADVADTDIRELVKQTLPEEMGEEKFGRRTDDTLGMMRRASTQPPYRVWYWALMDYGSFLKQTVGNLSRSSKSYVRQSRFAGSARQLRGAVIRALLESPRTRIDLAMVFPDERLDTVLADLIREGFIYEGDGRFFIV